MWWKWKRRRVKMISNGKKCASFRNNFNAWSIAYAEEDQMRLWITTGREQVFDVASPKINGAKYDLVFADLLYSLFCANVWQYLKLYISSEQPFADVKEVATCFNFLFTLAWAFWDTLLVCNCRRNVQEDLSTMIDCLKLKCLTDDYASECSTRMPSRSWSLLSFFTEGEEAAKEVDDEEVFSCLSHVSDAVGLSCHVEPPKFYNSEGTFCEYVEMGWNVMEPWGLAVL